MNKETQAEKFSRGPKVKERGIAVVRPGYGTNEIRLGQTESQAKAAMGTPDGRTRKYEGHYFYVYKERGLDLDFGRRGGKIKAIFFFKKGVQDHKGARIITDRGIRLGDSRSSVSEAYGEPDLEGEPFRLHTGEHFREWFYYSEGIQFRFNRNHNVDEISISRFRPPAYTEREER